VRRQGSISNEFQVGLLAICAAAAVIWATGRIDDRPDGGKSYTLYTNFPSVDGVYSDTPVKIAGVPIGAVEVVSLENGMARLQLTMQGGVQIPVDSTAELKADGMLGDKMVTIKLGSKPEYLMDGQSLQAGPPGEGLDALSAKASSIADDVKAITSSIRTMTEDEDLKNRITGIVDNVEQLSTSLNAMASDNRSELALIATNLKDVSISLKAMINTTGRSVEQELAAISALTATLERTAGHVESITARIDNGEGTVGRLLKDDTPVEQLTATLEEVQEAVGEVSSLVSNASRIQTDVYYRGSFFMGTEPTSGDFNNPMAGSMRNELGLIIAPREDYWYNVAFTSHPLGSFTYEDHYLPELEASYREYVTRPDYRLSFQFAKRFDNLVLRFGIKESSGGFGADYLLLQDRLSLSADLYDFNYGSWPVLDGTPNLELMARAQPWPFLYFEAGADNLIMGAKYGYFTSFIGGGFSFNDQDLKLILPALPISP
jgi:phospholipid/cholesterol/gamma-HCH transport system substrate-binding protein